MARAGVSDHVAGSGEASDTGSLAANGRIDHSAEFSSSLFSSAGENDFLIGGSQAEKDGENEESEGEFVHLEIIKLFFIEGKFKVEFIEVRKIKNPLKINFTRQLRFHTFKN